MLNTRNTSALILTPCLAVSVIFENCQPKCSTKFLGPNRPRQGRLTSVQRVLCETGHIFPYKVLQMILSQLICYLHRWCASAALKTAQKCSETYVLRRLLKLRRVCIALGMCMQAAWQEGKSGSLHPAVQSWAFWSCFGYKTYPQFQIGALAPSACCIISS